MRARNPTGSVLIAVISGAIWLCTALAVGTPANARAYAYDTAGITVTVHTIST